MKIPREPTSRTDSKVTSKAASRPSETIPTKPFKTILEIAFELENRLGGTIDNLKFYFKSESLTTGHIKPIAIDIIKYEIKNDTEQSSHLSLSYQEIIEILGYIPIFESKPNVSTESKKYYYARLNNQVTYPTNLDKIEQLNAEVWKAFDYEISRGVTQYEPKDVDAVVEFLENEEIEYEEVRSSEVLHGLLLYPSLPKSKQILVSFTGMLDDMSWCIIPGLKTFTSNHTRQPDTIANTIVGTIANTDTTTSDMITDPPSNTTSDNAFIKRQSLGHYIIKNKRQVKAAVNEHLAFSYRCSRCERNYMGDFWDEDERVCPFCGMVDDA